jgi:acetyl esterase/lipase
MVRDRELARALERFQRSGPPVRAGTDRLLAMRAGSGAFSAPLTSLERGGLASSVLLASGRDGPPVDLLVFRPAGHRPARACIYHIHGGGMVTGDSRTSIEPVLAWAEALGALVASVTYRLAPEHPFPAQLDDCYAGLRWVAGNAGRLGYGRGQLLVAGGSAGGGLAACTTLLARDRGGPQVLGAILMSPMLDDRTPAAPGGITISDGVWDTESNAFAWQALLGGRRGGADVSPYAAAARADLLDRLPPLYVDVGSAEILRAEVVEFASRVWISGGNAELHIWPGAYHGFDVIAPASGVSKVAAQIRLRWLGRVLGSRGY